MVLLQTAGSCFLDDQPMLNNGPEHLMPISGDARLAIALLRMAPTPSASIRLDRHTCKFLKDLGYSFQKKIFF